MKRRKLPLITKKIVAGILISGFLLCSLITGVGVWQYNRQFKKQYNETILSVASAACNCLNSDRFEYYLTEKKQDEQWFAIHTILQDFVEQFDLRLLYVSHVEGPDYTNITYLHNCVNSKSGLDCYPFAHSEVYEEPEYNKSARQVLADGEKLVRYTVSKRSGAHITANVPVYDSKGNAVAMLGVQKSVQQFVDSRSGWLRIVLIVEIVFAIVFFLLFSIYFSTQFIHPIILVTRDADHFASYGGEPSDKLLSIKNKDEIGTLAHTVHQMEYDVRNYISELTAVTAEKERISTELNVATKIQSDMLPKVYPPFPERTDFDLFATMSPAKEVGGDLYDYLLLDDDHLMIVVGDVSGKGVPAALFMVIAKTLLASHSAQHLSPKEIFETTNEQLCKGNESNLFVTCWLGILTLSTGELKFVNAGHPYPVLYHNGEFSYLKTNPNFVLAGMEGLSYTEHTITLSKGDRLFVYSDGVTEATNSKDELFGEKRLMEASQGTQNLSAPDTLKAIRAKIDEFVGEAEQFDDITMLQLIIK